MKHVYFSVISSVYPGPIIAVYLISPLNREAIDEIFAELMDEKHSSPSFPWDTAGLLILYHGMEKEKGSFWVELPDGRRAAVMNINPCFNDNLPASVREFAEVMEAMKTTLLNGGSCEEAANAARLAAEVWPDILFGEIPREHFLEDAILWKDMLVEWGYLKA